MNQIDTNKAAVREFTRVFKNEHNVDGIDHLFASDFRHHFKPPVRSGLAGFKDIGRMMNTAFPDVVVTEEDLIVTDDTVVERSSAAGHPPGADDGGAGYEQARPMDGNSHLPAPWGKDFGALG